MIYILEIIFYFARIICSIMPKKPKMRLLVSLCDKRFTPTQYALLSSLMGMSRVLAGIPTGFMAKGWIGPCSSP
jgi:PAT family beta-lactamase induction signal transducer AmpG